MQTEIDCAIVTGRYHSTTADDGPITTIELWGRSREGHSVVLLVGGIRPFIEISLPGNCADPEDLPDDIERRLKAVADDEDVTFIHPPVTKWTDLGEKKHWRVEVSQPYVVPRLRERLTGSDMHNWIMTSADILFQNRFFLNSDLGPHLTAKGEVVHLGENGPSELREAMQESRGEVDEFVAAQRVRDAGGNGLYPVDIVLGVDIEDCIACEPFAAPLVVFSFDLETSIQHDTILCAAACVENWGSGDRVTHTFQGDEEDILVGLTELVRSSDPDIITGYNIDNFDLPRLVDRTAELAGRGRWRRRAELLGWGRVPRSEDEVKRQRNALVPKRGGRRTWNIAGRCVMDTWWQARMALRPKRETLKFVSSILFPDDEDLQKMDIDASKMDEEWSARPDEVLTYCARDAELPLSILRSIQAVRRKEAIAAVAKVSLDTAANGSTSQLLDSLVIRLADSRNIAVPMSKPARRDTQITGGYVHDVEAGIHPWIAVLDFKSMYPSIMIGNNICYTTLIDPSQTLQPGGDDQIHESPTGAKYVSAKVRKGLVPELLEELMLMRDIHKTEMAKAKAENDDSAVAFHDQMQYAVKIMMNSFYGVFASAFYRFTRPNQELGSSITALARRNIKDIIQKLEEEGHHVVYSDTDSIFVSAPVEKDTPTATPQMGDAKRTAWEKGRDEMVGFAQELAKRFSEEGAVLEFEKGLSVFFSHGAKKRYVGRVVYPSEELIVRGYETRRTDSFDALTSGMEQLFEEVLDGRTDDAVQTAMTQIQAARRSQLPIESLIISKTCKGKMNKDGSVDFSKDYANPNSQAVVRAARKRIERNLPFTPGMKVAFVVTNANSRPMQVEPWNEAVANGGIPAYDGEFYAERLATAYGRVTEAFNWSANELLAGNRQSSLFSF